MKQELLRSNFDLADVALAAADIGAIIGPVPFPLKIAAGAHLLNLARRLF